LLGVSKEDLKKFRRAFSEIRSSDPEKYKLKENRKNIGRRIFDFITKVVSVQKAQILFR